MEVAGHSGPKVIIVKEPATYRGDSITSHVNRSNPDGGDTCSGIHLRAMCFQQNQRNEVRLMGEKTGAVVANAGMKNQNYIIVLNDQGGVHGCV